MIKAIAKSITTGFVTILIIKPITNANAENINAIMPKNIEKIKTINTNAITNSNINSSYSLYLLYTFLY